MEYRIGCSSWSYSVWSGHFYPSKMEAGQYLSYYSRIFDTVEIDSSFYRIPNVFMTQRWASVTPENFKFTAKFPRTLTHNRRLAEPEKDLGYWFKSFAPLKDKLAAFLIQLPPSLSFKEGFKKLQVLVPQLDNSYRYAIEFRHETWFTEEVYGFLSDNKICLTWSIVDAIKTPPKATTDFLYVRFKGDRSIDEKDFGTIQKDREKEMQQWARRIKKLKEMRLSIIIASNHFAGFGPGTANIFRKMVGLPEGSWEEMKQTKLA